MRKLGQLTQHEYKQLQLGEAIKTREVTFYHENGVYWLYESDVEIKRCNGYYSRTTMVYANNPLRITLGEGRYSEKKADSLVELAITTRYQGWFK